MHRKMRQFDGVEVQFVLCEARLRLEQGKGKIDVATALLGAGRCFPSTLCAAVYLLEQLSLKAFCSTNAKVIDLLALHPDVRQLLKESS